MKKAMAWALVILDILILPLAVYTLLKWLGIPEKTALMSGYFVVSTIGILLLRCFYIPYIVAAVSIPVLFFYHIREARQGKLNRRELVQTLILVVIAILGMLSIEDIFMAAMSV